MKIAFHTLGCKVNQYETEAMKEQWRKAGAEIVDEESEADVYIVNTCTVTNIADRKSRQYIRRMKKISPEALMVVTGCYAQVEADEVAAMPEVDLVVGNGLKSELQGMICEQLEARSAGGADEQQSAGGAAAPQTSAGTHAPVHVQITKTLAREELDYYEDMGLVESSESGMTRAYVKIQEGCDRFCSYCLIPYARGPVRSRPMSELLAEANLLISKGYKEIILTGINTALYGTEEGYSFERKQGEEGLTALEVVLGRLDEIPGDFRIRLSSLEPTVVDKEHVERIIRYEKLCHHLHLSMQAGSTSVLRAMNRHYTADEYLEIVKAIREFDPLYGITTDIIVGFPGETDEDFEESLRMVRECEFGRVHAFRYSPRRGTSGAALHGAVPGRIKAERAAKLATAADEAAELFARRNFEREQTVLVERQENGYMTGYTDNYIKVYIDDSEGLAREGEFCRVKLVDIFEDGCIGVVAGKGVKHE